MEDGREANLRLLAPVAVGIFAILFLIVVLSSGALVGGGSVESSSESGDRSSERSSRGERRGRLRGRATYRVKAGDTLGSIASRNDTTIERIEELNSELDPQTLTAGQKIKLRE
ncbi:MAG TPA: LysM domain-containing protein [Thermoleophilaceae bacterium]|nr:LysM domain-containing protein [Thermoleophilaceae bacterium]